MRFRYDNLAEKSVRCWWVFAGALLLAGVLLVAGQVVSAYHGPEWCVELSAVGILLSLVVACMSALCGILLLVAQVIISPRKRARGTCAKCGYSLAGLKRNICPECGHEIWQDA